jgi:hypothetical protein
MNSYRHIMSHWVCLYSLTHSWSWALLEKPPIVQPLKNFPAFYGTQRFITVFTRALHWSLFWARSIQSIPSHPVSLRSICSPTYVLVFPMVSYLLAFPPVSYMHSFSPPFALHALPISSSTWSFKLYLEKSTSYEAPHYVVFSNLLSLHLSLVEIRLCVQ